MVDRLVEDRWAQVRPRVMEARLDTLRGLADARARKMSYPDQAPRLDVLRKEHAALMWAIAELSGIGDEVRQRNVDHAAARLEVQRNATKRLQQAEALNAQYRVTIAALKADIYRLRGELNQAVGAVARPAASQAEPTPRV